MPLKNVIGIDHAVVMVRDLDQAAENWKRLGFTVSPRGTHSAHMGSGNATIVGLVPCVCFDIWRRSAR